MKNNLFSRRIFIAIGLLLSFGAIVALPVFNHQSLLDKWSSAPEATAAVNSEVEEEEGKPIDEQIWAEIQKLAQANAADAFTSHGIIRLYDHLNDEGIKESENFTLYQNGADYWLRLDSFDRVQLHHNLYLIDHTDREMVLQRLVNSDSLRDAVSMMSTEKIREMLEKDGTTAKLTQNGSLKQLNIVPGNMDAVNEYNIFYDAATYQIKKVQVAYTSFPYENYTDGISESLADQKEREDAAKAKQAEPAEATAPDAEDDDAIEADITEYIVEYEFIKVDKTCTKSLTQNELYTTTADGALRLNGQYAGYEVRE
jgi:hypothetical protein